MEIEKGFYVKCFLKNGFAVEGIVIAWSDEEIEIECIIDNSITLIHNPKEQLVITKISLKDPQEVMNKNKKISQSIEDKNDLQDVAIDDEEENNFPKEYKEVGQVAYGYPGFFKDQSAK